MRLLLLKLSAFVLNISFLLCPSTFSQVHGGGSKNANIREGLGGTWKGPTSTVISRLLIKRRPATTHDAAGGSRRPSPRPTPALIQAEPGSTAVTFKPTGDSGLAETLSSAFSSNATEKAALTELFRSVKQSYETEVAKERKSNNLAAAMTFFLAVNTVVYHDLEMPSDEVTEEVFVSLRDAMNATPEIARMSNTEKQLMHDWLVYMGGFVLAGYLEGRQNNDRETRANFREIANLSSKIIGVDISRITLDKNGITSTPAPRRSH